MASAEIREVETQITLANLVSIKYGSNFKVVQSARTKEQYVLTQCGTAAPTTAEVDAVSSLPSGYTRKSFTIPLQRAIGGGTVALGFVSELGVEDRMLAVDEYAVAPCWQKYLDCGGQQESSYGGNATILANQLSAADGYFMNCNWDGSCDNVKSQNNGILFSPTFEPGNLHHAEYVKYLAVFFNKEQEANAVFEQKMAGYRSYPAMSPQPKVAWIGFTPISSWNTEPKFTLSMSLYKQQYVRDVGAANVDLAALQAALPQLQAESDNAGGYNYHLKLSDIGNVTHAYDSTLASASAVFFEALSDVGVVIDEYYAPDPSSYDIDTFYAAYGLTSGSSNTFIREHKVLRIDGTMSEQLNLDWYESRIANPAWALEGLKRAITGDSALARKYFRNIAVGEVPEVLTKDSCTKELPVCNSGSVYPVAIPMPREAPLAEDETNKTPKRHALAAMALSALLCLARM